MRRLIGFVSVSLILALPGLAQERGGEHGAAPRGGAVKGVGGGHIPARGPTPARAPGRCQHATARPQEQHAAPAPEERQNHSLTRSQAICKPRTWTLKGTGGLDTTAARTMRVITWIARSNMDDLRAGSAEATVWRLAGGGPSRYSGSTTSIGQFHRWILDSAATGCGTPIKS